MAGNPREHVKGKGFWDGGAVGHGVNNQGAGRASGVPGRRNPHRLGIKVDLEFPPEKAEADKKKS